jgi:hypothetical protein
MNQLLIRLTVLFAVVLIASLVTVLMLTSNKSNENRTVEIEVISTPKYYTPLNEDIYLVGNFNNWNYKDERYKLTRLSHNTFKIMLELKKDVYGFKFSRGSNSTVETNKDYSNKPNRKLDLLNGNVQEKVNVDNWSDMKGNHTATGNVLIVSTAFPYPQLNTTKPILIYLPNDYFTSNKTYSVLYFTDGEGIFDSYFFNYDELQLDEIMENYTAHFKEPCIVVGIATSKNRTLELTPFPQETFPQIGNWDLGPGGKGLRNLFY